MIDFNNATFMKLNDASSNEAMKIIAEILIPDESVHSAFRGIRDWVIFTNLRVIAVNVQGITGKNVIILRSPTVISKLTVWKPRGILISTANSRCGSAD